jgi:hypothetical protein
MDHEQDAEYSFQPCLLENRTNVLNGHSSK